MKRKLEMDDEAAMRKKKIESLEGDIDELKKRLEEEIKKQKLSSDRLMEELVIPKCNVEKRHGKACSRFGRGTKAVKTSAVSSGSREGCIEARSCGSERVNRAASEADFRYGEQSGRWQHQTLEPSAVD